eukprot:6186774-Pleurochrysis_carterae.AAC.2
MNLTAGSNSLQLHKLAIALFCPKREGRLGVAFVRGTLTATHEAKRPIKLAPRSQTSLRWLGTRALPAGVLHRCAACVLIGAVALAFAAAYGQLAEPTCIACLANFFVALPQ